MKIVVAIKQVPEHDAAMRIDSSGKWIDEASLAFAINEPDTYALEEAFRMREQHGGEVIVVSAGPERVLSTLREALARGAERAIHVDCPDVHDFDPLHAARLLAAAIGPETPDLVLTGLQSDDLGMGQTGVILAELLGMPHASLILHIEKTESGITVRRELEDGWFQNIELPLPALLTIQSGANKLRYATLMGIKRARSKEIRTLAGTTLVADAAPLFRLERITLPEKLRTTQLLSGTTKQAAAMLVEKLKFEAHVL